jgi:signal transduction histidine kinase
MATDPQVIRSEPHAEVGTVIQRDAGLIIERWGRRAVQEQPNAKRVHHDALLDHLPALLNSLGQCLAESGDGDSLVHCKRAGQHGQQRWEAGWSLPEVVRDYQILRLVLIEYLEEILERPLSSREVMAIGLFLDEAIAASVTNYVNQREEYLRKCEEDRSHQTREVQQALLRQTEALREADRRKNEFLAVLAHELRNPLAALRNAVSVLQLYQTTDPPVVQVRDLFGRQVQQMARLVDDLLDVSRIAQGKIELRKERFPLAAAVGQAVQMADALIRAGQHRLHVSLPAEHLWLEADQARVVQVLINLLNNAAKYTNPGGQVWLSAAREGDEAVVRVRDTGVGIAPELLPHIFELFTQAEWAVGRSEGGLGIGLTLVRKLVELHGGHISAHSAGPGQGSEFVVGLPVCLEPGLPAAAEDVKDLPFQARHILIVEDNADGRNSLETLLTLLGHRVDVAEDGLKGVAKALAVRPEVALIDIGLPDLDGFQVAEHMRASLGEEIFLVALTGYAQPEDRRRSREVGFDAHLVKPVELEALQKLLARGRR